MRFEVELAYEGLIDRLDPLEDAAGVAVAVGLVLAVRAVALYSYARSTIGVPLLRYLAFYQSIEYFYPSFVNRTIAQQIRNVIRDPTFTAEGQRSLQGIIRIAAPGRDAQSERRQLLPTVEGSISEQEIRELLISQKEAVDFFAKKNRIGHVPAISLSSTDLFSQVAARLYRLRCRIVHTKAERGPGEVEVLLPFSTEANKLGHDLRLIQFISQRVIVAGSSGSL